MPTKNLNQPFIYLKIIFTKAPIIFYEHPVARGGQYLMANTERFRWSLKRPWAKGLGSSWSWAAKSQVQQEREAVSLSLLMLCLRTLINKELPFFQIYGNPEQHAHVTSRGENIFSSKTCSPKPYLSQYRCFQILNTAFTQALEPADGSWGKRGCQPGQPRQVWLPRGDASSITASPPSPRQRSPPSASAPIDNVGVLDCKSPATGKKLGWQWRIAVQSLNCSLCFLTSQQATADW